MSALDTSMRALAVSMCEQYGKLLTFTVEGGTYDATMGEVVSYETVYTAMCSPPQGFDPRAVTGDLILVSDLTTIIPASGLTFTPTNGMRVTFDSKDYRIVAIRPYMSGDQVAAYEVQLRP